MDTPVRLFSYACFINQKTLNCSTFQGANSPFSIFAVLSTQVSSHNSAFHFSLGSPYVLTGEALPEAQHAACVPQAYHRAAHPVHIYNFTQSVSSFVSQIQCSFRVCTYVWGGRRIWA